MLQIYFLSVVFPALSGWLLFKSGSTVPLLEPPFSILDEGSTARFVVGSASIITGVLTLLSPVSGIPFLGDAFPAAASTLSGLCLVDEYFSARDGKPFIKSRFFEVLSAYKRKTGVYSMIIAFLHFLLPKALFL
ncbi:MAG: hypothetical protein LBC53_03530 [Spirochaetaceae bacterium]|nr:hypothetical protein [Spirochaetaceae bacterium]